MKLLIPVLENKSFDSKISEHFGYAPFFALFDTETKELKIVENVIDHANSSLTPVDQIMSHDFDILYVLGIGGRAINLFKEKGVKVKTGKFKVVKEVIDNLEGLEELKESCGH